MNFGMVRIYIRVHCSYMETLIVIIPGQPITWAIADTEDINTYGEVFKAVKAKVPDADVNTIMTDDGKWHACYTTFWYNEYMRCFLLLQTIQSLQHVFKSILELFTFYADGMWIGKHHESN